ncbi:MAG TPA: HDOD domain-containing protein [Nitrospirales bacterium]|jgi:HD-like signal output (HDOD) protein
MPDEAAHICSMLTARLAGHSLPVIRQTSAKVIALLSSKHSDVEVIADAIRKDQSFMARILNVANSAYYRRRGDKITTISRAIMQIGYSTTRDIALAAEYVEFAHKRHATGVNLHRLLAKAFVAAHQASALATAVRLPDPEMLFTSALLESLGEFALGSYLPVTFKEIGHVSQEEGVPYDEAHFRVTGLTPHAITVLIATAYQLPEELIAPVPDWDAMPDWLVADRRHAVVHLANVCAANLFSTDSPLLLEDFNAFMVRATAALGLQASDIALLLTEAFQEALEFAATVKIERSSFALDKLGGETARQNLFKNCTQLIKSA